MRSGILAVLGRILAFSPSDETEITLAEAALCEEKEVRAGVALGLLHATKDGYRLTPKMRAALLILSQRLGPMAIDQS